MSSPEFAPPAGDVIRLRARTQMVSDGRRVVMRLGDRSAMLNDFDEVLQQSLHLIAQGVRAEALPETVAAFGPDGGARVTELITRLDQAGLLERGNPPEDVHEADLARFSRLIDFFSEFEDPTTTRFDLLGRMRSANVAVLGTGGLGSWTVYNLLCLGVGALTLIDGDVVEASNLNRSILFTEDDIGRAKVAAARDAIARFAPRTSITTHEVFVDGEQRLVPLLDGVDLLISCADQPPWQIRRWAALASRETGVPVLAVSGTRVGPLYVPGQTSCPMCDWAAQVERNPRLPAMLQAGSRLPRGTSGSLSPLALLAVGPALLDVLRFISGYARPATWNAALRIGIDQGSAAVPLSPRRDCPVCHGEALDGDGAG
ncbi:HesA/MoeB/ThiF family protein [Nonomuraea sp. NPDC004297]